MTARRVPLSLSVSLALAASTAAAGPRPTAPPATTQPALPAGVTLAPLVKLPTTAAFKPRAPGWWKKGQPCPSGAKLAREKIGSTLSAMVCRDRDGKQHGPGIALFTGDKPYEESWSTHGVQNGTRWTWLQVGKLDHTETFVDGKLQGPAEEYDMGVEIAAGAYLDGKKHGLWTYHYPTGLALRGYYDRGTQVGTWIGARDGVPAAILEGELGSGTGTGDRVWRLFDPRGNLTFERVEGQRATGWSAAGVRLAEYDCTQDGALTEARYFDDRGTLVRRWNGSTMTDAKGARVTLPADATGPPRDMFTIDSTMDSARGACSGTFWLLEGDPPARNVALGRVPKP